MVGLRALVDTSVLVGHGRPAADFDQPWAVSVVTIGELEAGVLMAADAPTRAARLRRLSSVLAEVPVLRIDGAVATRYGELRSVTRRAPTNDLWIAATALAHDLTLLTADERQAGLPLLSTSLLG